MNDAELITAIADRAANFYERHVDIFLSMPKRAGPLREMIANELWFVHREIVPLRLQALHDADDFNFMHDIAGIHRHLDIGKPCKFKDCFLPRYALIKVTGC